LNLIATFAGLILTCDWYHCRRKSGLCYSKSPAPTPCHLRWLVEQQSTAANDLKGFQRIGQNVAAALLLFFCQGGVTDYALAEIALSLPVAAALIRDKIR